MSAHFQGRGGGELTEATTMKTTFPLQLVHSLRESLREGVNPAFFAKNNPELNTAMIALGTLNKTAAKPANLKGSKIKVSYKLKRFLSKPGQP